MVTKATRRKGTKTVPVKKVERKQDAKQSRKMKRPAKRSTTRGVLYQEPDVKLFGGRNAPFTVDEAKKLIGWETEPADQDTWGEDYVLRDFAVGDKPALKVRLTNNPSNRPFRLGLAKRYMTEMVRGKWKLNGETVIVDHFGYVQSGQHRLVGFILAEQLRQQNPTKWRDEYDIQGELTLELAVFYGISPDSATVDSIDQGQKRTLGDVLYRQQRFKEVSTKELKSLSNILAIAARLVWLRAGGKTVSDAPQFPISEAVDFLELHPRIMEAVEYINLENRSGSISEYVSLGYAAGLMYLMGMSATDPDEFMEEGAGVADDSLWGKAQEFWSEFASDRKPKDGSLIHSLKECLEKCSGGSSLSRDQGVAVLIKAFNFWIDGKKTVKPEILFVDVVRENTPSGFKWILTEEPRLGGMDTGDRKKAKKEKEEPEGPVTPKLSDPSKVKRDKSRKGKNSRGKWKVGNTAWVEDADGELWFGEITGLMGEDGTGFTMMDLDTEEEWEVVDDQLSLEYPKLAD